MKKGKAEFPTKILKVGKAIRVICEIVDFESECIITQAHSTELTIVYFEKESDDLVESVLTIEDVIYNDYYIEILN
ncbi:TPA: hypothetical protein SOK69_003875 [Clostridioides difficile]|uniref:hypothetical protein n=1 Tax=Clostridioides difficile TaxID=1496 RepID=UPI0003B29C44|nr:hypothetical protein [Clostridioides difficile]MBZ0812354.1 hypothetical protein [Clostridioides difficile]MBZ0839057.1 hypothetical protein [Clostridioides difficile]MCE0686319.1 hypothetical protein [Clostridioides difficile]MCE0712989.1 hypothetical protein [Clostridioides difficile]MCE0719004.1 hypothetical protein [Clostridioides difficile]